MKLEIRYLNEFTYEVPARESHNLLRACPSDNAHQRLLSYEVEVTPKARIHSYTDFWGTRVDEFGVREPHHVLRVSAESLVETETPPVPTADPDLGDYRKATDLVTYLRPSPHARWDEAITALAREAVDGHETAVPAILAICDLVTSTLDYVPGATFVGVAVSDVLTKGAGVCQDFAHLALAMYRSVGIPARYVSGYLYAADQTAAIAPEEPELDVQTHAWVEVYVPGHGWWPLDPTNPQPVGELHVKIGHGRDYEDVMPLRGVYHGGAKHDLGVRVNITRERLGRLADQ